MDVTSLDATQIVSLLVAVVAPLVVGLLTKSSTSKNIKAIALAAIAAAIGVANGFLATPHDKWSWSVAIVNGVIAWVVAVAVHFGFWKPVGATEVAQNTLVK
jgi:hypothetical protein